MAARDLPRSCVRASPGDKVTNQLALCDTLDSGKRRNLLQELLIPEVCCHGSTTVEWTNNGNESSHVTAAQQAAPFARVGHILFIRNSCGVCMEYDAKVQHWYGWMTQNHFLVWIFHDGVESLLLRCIFFRNFVIFADLIFHENLHEKSDFTVISLYSKKLRQALHTVKQS
jgi:hypothetical protein